MLENSVKLLVLQALQQKRSNEANSQKGTGGLPAVGGGGGGRQGGAGRHPALPLQHRASRHARSQRMVAAGQAAAVVGRGRVCAAPKTSLWASSDARCDGRALGNAPMRRAAPVRQIVVLPPAPATLLPLWDARAASIASRCIVHVCSVTWTDHCMTLSLQLR